MSFHIQTGKTRAGSKYVSSCLGCCARRGVSYPFSVLWAECISAAFWQIEPVVLCMHSVPKYLQGHSMISLIALLILAVFPLHYSAAQSCVLAFPHGEQTKKLTGTSNTRFAEMDKVVLVSFQSQYWLRRSCIYFVESVCGLHKDIVLADAVFLHSLHTSNQRFLGACVRSR